MRLFVAIYLPEEIRESLKPFWNQTLSGAKWIPEDQVHLTLRFIGETDEKAFEEIRSALATLEAPSLELGLKGVGCFPTPKRPRVLWVGLKDNPLLHSLQKQIERKVREAGIPREENKAFSPHITLARMKFPNSRDLIPFLERNKDFQTATWLVKEFHLYSSQRTPKGAIHKIEATYKLS
jgi:2'-5' RNA ligase